MSRKGQKQSFLEEENLKSFIKRRNRRGLVWHIIFQASTIIGIIALTALLYNIIIASFGYVVVQDTVAPSSLVLTADENQMLNATDTIASEDDDDLIEGIINNPQAIGFAGYAYYQENQDQLRPLIVDGIAPTAETVADATYPYGRSLFIYTTPEIMQEKPNVAAFTNFYLTHLSDHVLTVGYFQTTDQVQTLNREIWLDANGLVADEALPEPNLVELDEEMALEIAGSSTVYPLTREVAKQFRRDGYAGGINLEQIGSSAGFAAFCVEDGVDIVNASRPINRAELEACRAVNREPIAFTVAVDALAVIVSTDNSFLENVSLAELGQIFTTAQTWSEVNPAWPDIPIKRFIPGQDSGTLDFFADTTFQHPLTNLPKETLVSVLQNNVTPNRYRVLERDNSIADLSQEEIYNLVVVEVVQPRVIKSWSLLESFTHRAEIKDFPVGIPNARLEFRSWLNLDFVTNHQSSIPDLTGVRTALFGSLWVIFITIIVSLPLGIGAAIYLEEYATQVSSPFLKRLNIIIQTNINNLAGVPSIIYGMLGLAIFVRALGVITQGRTIFSAGLTLALLILPVIIISSQEAIRAVPSSLRQASMGLGATKWQTIWHHVLPNALPGVLTGAIIAISRAIGETAPLVVIGASTFITVDPNGPFSKFTTLPIQIYAWTSEPEPEFRNAAGAAIIVLLILLLSLNASAVLLRNRFSRRLS